MAKQNTNADVDFIKALAELLHENDLTELEVKREYGEADKLNVRVSRAKQIVRCICPPLRLQRQHRRRRKPRMLARIPPTIPVQ